MAKRTTTARSLNCCSAAKVKLSFGARTPNDGSQRVNRACQQRDTLVRPVPRATKCSLDAWVGGQLTDTHFYADIGMMKGKLNMRCQ